MNDWKRDAEQYRDVDQRALETALVRMHVCPRCRADMRPVALTSGVWGCAACKETHFIEE